MLVSCIMNLVEQIDRNNLHHAYLIEGDAERIVPDLFAFLESIGVSIKANPDFWHRTFDTFTIEDARALKSAQIQKAVSGGKKIFVIQAGFFTTEAQNALLKVFEEPASGVHFFIITPRADSLLKTLHSRVVIVRSGKKQQDTLGVEEANKFVEGERGERLEFVKALAKKYDKEETSMLLKIEALTFLNNLEYVLQGKTNRKKENIEDYYHFEEIWRCRKYLMGRGSSVKMLLEHLALVV